MQAFLAALLCVTLTTVYGQGAGRAIPIATENFVIELFRTINPRITYDTTNFLVDLSGNYANCDFIGRRQHERLDRYTPEGATIGLVQDYTRGLETHTRAVDEYLRPVFEGWVYSNSVNGAYGQIQAADRFGCSVRPGCQGDLSVACLFSPYHGGIGGDIGEQRAVAFTVQQYNEAEFLTTQTWDRSHFLENLSGYETRCDMITRRYHDFPYATQEAAARGHEVIGLFGSTRNLGSTPDALMKILDQMKQNALDNLEANYERLLGYFDPAFASMIESKEVGCSLIPDCIFRGDMYVVVSCIFKV